MVVPQKKKKKERKLEQLYDPGSHSWVIQLKRTESRDSKRYVHVRVHSSTVHSSQEAETSPCPPTEQPIKNTWWICTMEYYSVLKKEGNLATWYNMDGP